MKITENLKKIRQILQKFPHAKLVCVTKNQSISEIENVLKSGIKIIGENRFQEAAKKFQNPIFQKIQKRFIGHLQSNKAAKVVQIFDAIDSIDSLKIAEKVDFFAEKVGKKMPILIQINIANDPKKAGFSAENFLKVYKKFIQFRNLKIAGFSTMPKLEKSENLQRKHFQNLKTLFEKVRSKNIFGDDFCELSMGTSRDFKIALSCGATMVRIGGAIFD